MLAPLLLLAVTSLVQDPMVMDGDTRQIAWLSDLDAAVRIAQEENRPLLVALNMDGESASERIVREHYRDPAFVARTRRCVCVIASVFRHTPRDFDDEGRRIPCPRLGRVTCGEHIALEPVLFDRFLGEERIAPRHAVIQPDGSTSFDLSLLFDLRDLEAALDEALVEAPPMARRPTIPADVAGAWRLLFRRTLDQDSTTGADLERLAAVAHATGVAPSATAVVRQALRDVRELPGDSFEAPRNGLLPLLARLDGESAATRTTLLAWLALGSPDAPAALDPAFDAATAERIRAASAVPAHFAARLDLARQIRAAVPLSPRSGPPRRSVDELAEEYRAALEELARQPDDVETQARVGLLCCDYARERLDSGMDGADLLLADAETFLQRALEQRPDHLPWLHALARTYYVGGRWSDEERVALRLVELTPLNVDPAMALEDLAAELAREDVQEMLRWVGDASGRMLFERQGGDPVEELVGIGRGAEAWLLACASPASDDSDWSSAAGYFGVLGLYRQQIAVLTEGLRRFPHSVDLRNSLNGAYATIGRPELALDQARRIAAQFPDSAEDPWYVGYQLLMQGDWLRRKEQPELAIDAYRESMAQFRSSRERNEGFAASCLFYEALAMQSIGFAHLLAQRQEDAARSLVEALAIAPSIADVRDGLDRESLDLLDGALEWRMGRLSPVDPTSLREALLEADTGNSYWAQRLSDTELREALRADGRHDPGMGDRLLQQSIAAAERAVEVADLQVNRVTLAQSHTIFAERLLERGDAEAARPHLRAAAPLMDHTPPSANADEAELRALAAALRSELGEPRPIERPGR